MREFQRDLGQEENVIFRIVYENPNLPGDWLLCLRNCQDRYSLDLLSLGSQRSLGWIDFQILGNEAMVEVCDPVDLSFVRNNHICGIFVKRELRGKEVGTDLVKQAARFLSGKGVKRMVFKALVYKRDGFYGQFDTDWEVIKEAEVLRNSVSETFILAEASVSVLKLIQDCPYSSTDRTDCNAAVAQRI